MRHAAYHARSFRDVRDIDVLDDIVAAATSPQHSSSISAPITPAAIRLETRQALEAHTASRRKEEAAAVKAEAEWASQPSKVGRPPLTQLPWSASTTTYNLTPEMEVWFASSSEKGMNERLGG